MSFESDGTQLDEELRWILQEAAIWESEKRLSLPEAYFHAVLDVQLAAILKINELGKRLPELLTVDRRFPGTAVLMLPGGSGGHFGFYPNFVAVPLVLRLLRTRDPEDTIAWLQKVLTTTDADGWSVSLFWYVTVAAEFHLTEDIRIVPVGDIPESVHTRWIAHLPLDLMRFPMGAILAHPPAAALIRRIKVKPFLYSPAERDDPVVVGEQQSVLHEVGMALTALGPRPIIAVANWTTLADPDLDEANLGGGRSHYFTEIMPSFPNRMFPLASVPGLDPSASRFVEKYLALSPPTRGKVSVALSRLNQALRRFDVGDGAIELSIAFEALVGEGSTEITHKVKVRSVRLLGGSLEERQFNAALIGKMYSLRSTLVHTGTFSQHPVGVSGQPLSPRDIVSRSAGLCADLIVKIVDLGQIPEWHTFDISE